MSELPNTSTEQVQEEIEVNPRSISFSTLTDAKKCGEYYRLKNIEKLYPFTDSIWTHYGTLVHKYIQAVLMDEIEPDVACKKFIRTWFRFCQFYRKQLQKNLDDEEYKLPNGAKKNEDIYRQPALAILNIKKLFKEQFGEHKVLWVEYRLKSETDYPQVFKGLIDIGIELANGDIVIADFKTSGSLWMFNKYRDKYKDYQLTLYKSFYVKETGIDPKSVETYFIVIPKEVKSKKCIEFIRVTSGPRKVLNALAWLNETLQKVEDNSFQKNRMACRNFFGKNCPFFQTEHCTS